MPTERSLPRPPRHRLPLTTAALLLLLLAAAPLAADAALRGPSPGTPTVVEAAPGQAAPLASSATQGATAVAIDDPGAGPADFSAPQYSIVPVAPVAPGALARRVGNVFHVKPVASGNGSGSDWANASGDLQAMIDAAAADDQVWVAAGVYRPGPANDRTSSFELKSGVAVYGGFAGNEPPGFDLLQRDLVANQAILSGDLLGDDGQQPVETDPTTNTNTADNAFTVVDASGVGAGTAIDGFTITAGRADAFAAAPSDSLRGGGLYMNTGTLAIGNCRFVGNLAGIDPVSLQNSAGGAAIYVTDAALGVFGCLFSGAYGYQGSAIFEANSNVLLDRSDFVANTAVRIAGAVVSGGSLTIVDCNFSDNQAGLTAGTIFTTGVATVERSTFTGNLVTDLSLSSAGGAIYSTTNVSPPSLEVVDCTFSSNTAVFGGAITSFTPSTIRRSDFDQNSAIVTGGGVYFQAPGVGTVDSCNFTSNLVGNGAESQSAGGGLGVSNANLLVTNSLFQLNRAVTREQGQQQNQGGGGGLYVGAGAQNTVTVEGCTFLQNTAQSSNGGAILARGGVVEISGSLLQANAASYWGGAICSNWFDPNRSVVTATDCLIYGNAATYGGGLMAWYSSFTLDRVVVENNSASVSGGGMSVSYDGLTSATNSVLFNNRGTGVDSGGGGLLVSGGATPTLTNVTLSANSAPYGAAIAQLEANSNTTVVNGILYGNPSGDGTPFLNATNFPGATGTLSYTLMEEAACPPGANCGAGMLFATDPLFMGPDDPRLQPASPAIDAGTNTGAPATDLLGNPRALTAADPADMGAYEFFLDCDGNGVQDAVEIAADPSLDCNADGFLDACEIAGLGAYGRVALGGNTGGISSDGSFAWLVDASTSRLDVLDVSDPAKPTLISTLTGFPAPSGNPRHPLRVDDTLYIATQYHGIHVYDVSNPATPTRVRSISGGTGGGLGQPLGRFARQGNYLFVPLEQKFSYPPGLAVLDISNRGFPSLIAFVPISDTLSDVVVSGDYAYASARANGANPPVADLYVFDVQDPGTPSLALQTGAPDEAQDIALLGSGHVLTVGATTLEVYDISTPGAATRVAGLPLPAAGQSVQAEGAVVYVGAGSELLAYDFSDPLAPQLINSVTPPAPVWQTTLLQGRLVASCTSFGAAVFNQVLLDSDGNSIPDVCETSTSVPTTVPTAFALHTATPNPFNPSTTIRFDLPRSGPTELAVYDVAGRWVRTLVRDTLDAGSHSVVWTGRDDRGQPVASGVYLYRLVSGSEVRNGRMVLLK